MQQNNSKLMKYYFKYKLFENPYYFEFTCYAESVTEAKKLFILNMNGMVEDYRIAYIEKI